jgi:serine/threonine-protein kinase
LLEDYLATHRELGSASDCSLELVGVEYQVRCWAGDLPRHEEYLQRFGDRSGQVIAILRQADRERARETPGSRGSSAATNPSLELPSADRLFGMLCRYGLLVSSELHTLSEALRESRFREGRDLVRFCLERDWLTAYQCNLLLQEKGADLILGPYLVLGRLGRGGSCEVFKGRHQVLDRLAAIKVIRRDLLSEPEAVRRFYREAEAAGRLKHPHIVEAYDAGPWSSTHFIAMEYVEGADLSRIIKDEGALPSERACEYIRQAALGLQHAHSQGIVHRDVKPSNLILSKMGLVRVLDFGLARFSLTGDRTETTLTTSDGFIGTIDFMAPEQGVNSHAIGHQADVYSLGATLYYLLSGRVAFPGGNLFDKLNRLQTAEPLRVEQFAPGISPELADFVSHMMAKRPEDRPQSMSEVIEVLDGMGAALNPTSRPPQHLSLASNDSPQSSRVIGVEASSECFDSATIGPGSTSSAVSAPEFSTERHSVASYVDRRFRAREGARRWARWGGGASLLLVAAFLLLLFRDTDSPQSIGPCPPLTSSPAAPLSEIDQWVQETRRLPPDTQIDKVKRKLRELNNCAELDLDFVAGEGLNRAGKKVVVELEIRSILVKDLSPLQVFENLEKLKCVPRDEDYRLEKHGILDDLAPLLLFPKLSKLDINSNQIADLAVLGRCTHLTELDISRNQIQNLGPLSKCTKLRKLECYTNQIRDLSPLNPLENLSSLSCGSNPLGPNGLVSLKSSSLASLCCDHCGIENLTPLAQHTGLRELYIDGSSEPLILAPLGGLKFLHTITIYDKYRRYEEIFSVLPQVHSVNGFTRK